MPVISLARLPLAMLCAVSIAAGEPALVNGSFSARDDHGLLQGWTQSATGVQVVEEAGRPTLVLRTPAGATAWAAQTLALDSGWAELRFRYRVRVASVVPGSEAWHTPRIALTFLAGDGTQTHAMAGMWKTPQPGWQDQDLKVAVPFGAERVHVTPATFNAAAEWALADLRIEVAGLRSPGVDAALPAGEISSWGLEPVEERGPWRGEVCLNGRWRFQPAAGPGAQTAPATGWGWQRVPGSWAPPHWSGGRQFAGGLVAGSGPMWEGFNGAAAAAWYERDLAIPEAWAGRMIQLDLRRVSTDAIAWIDGTEVGQISWPGGEIDLGTHVQPGKTHRLRLLVVAAVAGAEQTRFMGTGAGQVTRERTELKSRGLIGDVLLTSRPRGGQLAGMAIRTSVREHRLEIVVAHAGLPTAGSVELVAAIRDAAGTEVRRFAATADAKAGNGTVTVGWSWSDPELWDLDRPHLYTLELAARGAGWADALVEQFGFREFRIDGRRFLLNETEIRLRPGAVHLGGDIDGVRELVGAAFDGLRWAGFNCHEMWPWNRHERGAIASDPMWCEEADRRGFLLIAPALDQTQLVDAWNRPGVADAWSQRMSRELGGLINHPSVVMWVTGANRFGHGQDQNPEFIGAKQRASLELPSWQTSAAIGEDIVARVKAVDPTRPVMLHAGGPVGEVYTANNYLCLTPLQEREEWPARWAADGDMPMMMVEFGTPFFLSFHRGRSYYASAVRTEPLYSEYCAIYQGSEAYRNEGKSYRAALAESFEKGQSWRAWHSFHIMALRHGGFESLEALFIRNTWRSWRSWGVTGGMLPWANGHGWLGESGQDAPGVRPVALPPFQPGRRGVWMAAAPAALLYMLRPEGMPQTAAGEALVANNRDTLAYLAGSPEFIDKTHNFRAGSTIAKQVAVINDRREVQSYSATWSLDVAGTQVASGTERGEVGAARSLTLPISIRLPVGGPASGVLRLDCRIGDDRHVDAFPIQVFAVEPGRPSAVALVDATGDTAALLKSLGVSCIPWDGLANDRLVVVGRNAMATGVVDPAALERCLQAGGRVLLMAQDPAWLRARLGLRVSRQLIRRAFPVIAEHPALAGLDAEALRDWAGSSLLLPRSEAAPADALPGADPVYGWRLGGRHALSSAAIEIPHRAGWRPLLTCGFDGAFTPLAEVAVGPGLLTVCTLDLEDHLADPAAERLARALLDAAAQARPAPRMPAIYIGGDAGAALLDQSGVIHRRNTALPAAGLVVLGSDAVVADEALDAFMRRGGRVLVLPRRDGQAPLGVSLAKAEHHSGSLLVPGWPSCRGLSASELRRRVDGPAWTVTAGADAIGAEGLLAEVRRGNGVAVFCQYDSEGLDADRLTYNRLTRWRWTRLLTQLAANLGGSCAEDASLLHPLPMPDRISLAGTWKATLTAPLPAATADGPKPLDPGLSARARALVTRDADETGMQEVAVSRSWETYGGAWAEADGEAVFRRVIEIPAAWAGRDLQLTLGAVDDFDNVFFDGTAVGSTDRTAKNFWVVPRSYRIPAALVNPGRHVVAVRVFDHFGGGGMVGRSEQLGVAPADVKEPPLPAWYHADWRGDFPMGDDPDRYFRW